MPYEEAKGYRFNPFDITKVWPKSDYPLIPVGRLVLDRNPDDFIAQIEQAAFSPSNFIGGVGPSPDKMLQARMRSYPNFHRARVVLGGGSALPSAARSPGAAGWDDEILRAANAPHRDDGDFVQAGVFVRTALDDAARDRLMASIIANVSSVTRPEVRREALSYWRSVDPTLGERAEAGL
jgi:catalase